jgi:putative aminopeptidase FrvX
VLSVVGGGTEATAQRVTIASDSTGVLSVDDNGASLTVDGTVATAGTVAHDAAASGANPVLVGLEARTTNGTPVASADLVRAMADTLGKQVILLGAPNDLTTRGLTNYTNTTGADVIAAAGAGVRIVVMGILVVNGHATVGTKVSIRDGTTAKITGYAAALGGGFSIGNGTPIFISTANTAVTAICVTTGSDVDVNVWGYLINN